MKAVAHPSIRNKLYQTLGSGSFLYVNRDGRVGHGWSKEDAMSCTGNHGHWLEPDGFFPEYVVAVRARSMVNK